MSYGLKYQSKIYPPDTGNEIFVDIYKQDYTGAVTPLKVGFQTAAITMESADYFTQIRGTAFSIQYINTLADFFELETLFMVNDFEFQIKVYNVETVYFNGYIPCSIVEQQYYQNGIVSITAADNLKRLNEFYPTMFAVRDAYTLISVIKHCLSFTGLNLPVYVNCSIWESRHPLNYNSLFDQVYVYSDLFLDDDIHYKDCDYILKSILASFDCFIYYWDDTWRIERFKDMGSTSKRYIIYGYGSTSPTWNTFPYSLPITFSNDIGTPNGHITIQSNVFNEPVINIGKTDSDLRWANMNQVVSYVPGVKKITLNLQEKMKNNLVNYYFNDCVLGTAQDAVEGTDYVGSGVSCPWPSTGGTWQPAMELYQTVFYQWMITELMDFTPLENYNHIDHGVILKNKSNSDNGITSSYQIANWIGTLPSQSPYTRYYATRSSLSGLYTKFKFTLNDSYVGDTDTKTGTTLTLAWKFIIPPEFINNGHFTFGAQHTTNTVDHNFYVRFFLKTYINGKMYFVVYSSVTGKYFLQERTSIVTKFNGGGAYTTGYDGTVDVDVINPPLIQTKVNFGDFTNKTLFLHEYSIDILIDDLLYGVSAGSIDPTVKGGDAHLMTLVDTVFTLGICELGYCDPNLIGNTLGRPDPTHTLKNTIIGDIKLTVNTESPANTVEGKLNTNYVDNIDEDILIYDTTSNNILNGPYNDSEMVELTELWNDANLATTLPIVKRIIEDQYQVLYDVRRQITSDIYYKGIMKPFTMIKDTHYPYNFFLNSFQWVLDSNMSSNSNFKEYIGNANVS